MRLRTRHRRVVAFLAIAALWLLVAAPVISQVLPSRSTYTELNAYCDGMAGMTDHGDLAMPDPHGGQMAVCGYCGLLGHAPTMPGAVYVAMFVPSTPLWAVPLPVAPIPATPPWLDAAPRGPPGAMHA